MKDGSYIYIGAFWERDYRNFEDGKRTADELKAFLFKTLFLWTRAIDFNGINVYEFLNSAINSSNIFFFLMYTGSVFRLCL